MKLDRRLSRLESKKIERKAPFFFERTDGSIKSLDPKDNLLFDDRQQFRQYLEEKRPDHPVTLFKPTQ